MNIKNEAKKFYKELYSLPPAADDLERFAKVVLDKFIEELENNTRSVAWNYGCDSVIFSDKSLDGKKSLKEIKKEFLDDGSNASNKTV